MLEKVLGIERKITKAEEKLNPIPQVPAGQNVQQPGMMADGQYGAAPGGYISPNVGGQAIVLPPVTNQVIEAQLEDDKAAEDLSKDESVDPEQNGEDEGR